MYKLEFNKKRERFYTTDEKIVVRKKDEKIVVAIPYFTICKKNNKSNNYGKKLTNHNKIIDIEVGFEILFKIKNKNNEYIIQRNNAGSVKDYRLNSGTIKNLNKITTQMKREIIGKTVVNKYIVNINLSKQLLNINYSDINSENLMEFLENLNDFNLVELSEMKSRKLLLESFKSDLELNLNRDEITLEIIFKKYQDLFPLIIKGIDAALDFQYYIPSEDRVIIADSLMIDANKNINIIELKKATDKFFTISQREYRTNTIRLNPNFSNAIHQANLQRAYNSASNEGIYNVHAKSVLIYGNKREEFNNENKNLLVKNLENIKYNNKDLTIISYDEIIDRIKLILNKLYENGIK